MVASTFVGMKKHGWGGDVLRVGAAALASEGLAAALPGARPRGEVVRAGLRSAAREAELVGVAATGTALLQDAELSSGMDALARTAGALMRTRVRLACEAAGRGLHQLQGYGLADWLARRSPDLDERVVRDLARVATASTEEVHQPLVDAVLSGGMSLARAGAIHRALVRIRGAITPEKYADAVELLADVGVEPVFDDKDIRKIINALLRTCLAEKDHNERARAKEALRDVHESSLADGTVKRIVITFGDDADYEAVKAVLNSPLAAPASKEEQEATGVPEMRSPGARRYDALMTVLRRGVAGTKGQPTTPKATLVVTLDFDTLRASVEDAARRPGCGATLAGESISAATIRRLACEADIVPMVLGGPSEIVDQGRSKRLVTPGQRLRLAARDGGCTIPGCTVPATWCDAHHIVPWANGGRSDLSNYALLCPRHHTWVHTLGLTATVTALGVVWQLR